MKALSIMQPWAQLIVDGIKPVENRTWPTTFRGSFLIHAGKKFDFEGYIWLVNNWYKHGLPLSVGDLFDHKKENDFPRGGIIGQAEIVDCVTSHPSPFFSGPYGFVIANAKPIEPRPLRGMLGFFEVPWSMAIELANR